MQFAGVEKQGSHQGKLFTIYVVFPPLLSSALLYFLEILTNENNSSKMPTEIEGTHEIGDMSLYTKTWKVC